MNWADAMGRRKTKINMSGTRPVRMMQNSCMWVRLVDLCGEGGRKEEVEVKCGGSLVAVLLALKSWICFSV